MRKKYYLVEEHELKNLLVDSAELQALNSGEVEDWPWYGESCHDFINIYIEENDIHFEDGEDKLDFWFGNIGEIELKNYPAVMLDLKDLQTPRFISMELSN